MVNDTGGGGNGIRHRQPIARQFARDSQARTFAAERRTGDDHAVQLSTRDITANDASEAKDRPELEQNVGIVSRVPQSRTVLGRPWAVETAAADH